MSGAKKFNSFGITIRPRDGCDDKLINEFQTWFKKQDFIYAVTEKEGSARHIHFQFWSEEGKYISDVKKQMKRICSRNVSDWDKAQEKYAVFVKVAYNDWYEDYLEDNPDKPEEVNVIYESLPDSTLKYYPTEEEDERMKAASNAVDKHYFELSTELEVYLLERDIVDVTKMTIAKFLHQKQHVDKTMKVIREQKIARGLVTTLYTHYTQEFDPTWYLPEVESTNKQLIKTLAQVAGPESLDLT